VPEPSDDLLGPFIDASHSVAPDGLATLVAEHARRLPATEAVIYLASYEQRTLEPLPGPGVPERQSLDIDATLGGRAFRALEMTEADGRLWVPLLDGTQRLGVLELLVPGAGVGDRVAPRARQLAGIVSELIVSRSLYGDVFHRTRRRRPLTVAAELQWDLLPPQTFSDSRVTISGVLEPTYEVAGDSFDYALNGDTLLFMIADAMGHGFEATMLTTVAIGAYRHSRRLGLDLASTYCAMDALVAERFGPDRFLTAQLGELDMRTGVLRLLNAGHPAPLTVRERGVANLSCEPTLPIGFGGVVTEVVEERLQPGQHVLLYTDGVVEARAEDGEFFGEKRLEDLLVRAITAELPAAETVRRLAHAILEHQGGELQDDATTVLLTWHGTG
jgi:hypothetical protein